MLEIRSGKSVRSVYANATYVFYLLRILCATPSLS